MAECYVAGVSTRRVDGLVQTLGIQGISKSQVSEMAKSLGEMVEAFGNRPLDGRPYRYVWLDTARRTSESRKAGKSSDAPEVEEWILGRARSRGHSRSSGISRIPVEPFPDGEDTSGLI